MGCDDVDWIHGAQDMDQFRVVLNIVMILPAAKEAETKSDISGKGEIC
jgi:hypothetical protein